MKTVDCFLSSVGPYSQSKKIRAPKKEGESPDDYERRTWRERLHVDDSGNVRIPPMAFANCIKQAAKFLGIKIPGKGNSMYTKHFEAGVMVLEPLVLDIKAADVEGEWHLVPANGQRGGSAKVDKCFPVIPAWSGVVRFHVMDPVITEAVFERVLTHAGALTGIGRFRPTSWGYYGRFRVEQCEWADWTDE